MKHLKYLALVSTFALLFSFNAFAKDKNQRSVNIPDSVSIAGTQLAPGNYKVIWQGAGPAVNVNFLQHGKVVASAPATLRTNDKVTQDDVITDDTTGTKAKTLREIDFLHQKEALVFGQNGM